MSATKPQGEVWVRDFTPGYLDSPESDTLPLGATPDAKNGFLYAIDLATRRAVMGRRPGSRLITPTTLSSGAVGDGLFDWRRTASDPTLLAMCNGELSSIDTVAGTSTPIASGWTAGTPARMTMFREDAFVYDGTLQKRWDGTTAYDVGSAEPSTITNMSAGAGTVTGTYEALYTWYNSNRDRHSSPSSTTSTLALVAQGRTHTKPGSTAPTWATHWGIWVRRTDTSELNFYFVQNVAIATGSSTETVSDTTRQRGDLAPLPSSHDAPPGAWQVLVEYKGFGFGILPSSDSYYVSASGDLESWHPRNKFPVSRASGDPLCWAATYGTQLLIGTSHRTWRLVGDQIPFKPEPIHPRYGNVSQDACVEVDGRFYGWDRKQGPYVTDLGTWRAIGRHRIDDYLGIVNKAALSGIKACYIEDERLIGWLVATGSSTRRRTILWYHIDLDCWLPPQTGLEYGSITEFTDADGTSGIYLGDYWGRILELFSGAKEGVPTTSPTDNVREAAVVSATSSTVTVDVGSSALYTTGSGLAGLPVAALSPAGVWQWRRIQSNTADTITLDTTNDTPWDATPDSTYTVVIGGIEWFHWTPWIDFSIPHKTKKLQHLYVQAKSTSSEHEVAVRMRFNNDEGVVQNLDLTFDVALSAGIWGVSLWGAALWAETQRQMKKKSVPRSPLTAQFQFSNYLPDQDIKVPLFGLTADVLSGMEVPSS